MTSPSPTDQLRALLAEPQIEALREFLQQLPAEEGMRVVSRLDNHEQAQLLALLPPDETARLVYDMPQALAVDMLEQLPAPDIAAILDRLPSDVQTDLLVELDTPLADDVLGQMAPGEAADVKRLRGYSNDTAGGLMVTEYLAYPETARVGEVLDDLRTHAQRYAEYEVQYVYVVSRRGDLRGVARLRDLLFLPDHTLLNAAVLPNPAAVRADAHVDELRTFFDQHGYVAAPVVDDTHRLVGVVTRAIVEEAAMDRAERSFQRFSGIVAGEEFRSMPLRERVAGRMAWLAVTLLLNLLAASVVGLFDETLSAVIALAVFLPVISGMSGNAGNQSIAVTMRELTLGLVRPHELGWVIFKEAAVGVINGLVLGLVLALAALAWKGNIYLGVVVGTAQSLNVLIAVCLGGTIPLMLKRAGLDPALASAPLLTTITDASGFFLTLGSAWLLLPALV
jgi:magnesium transporter